MRCVWCGREPLAEGVYCPSCGAQLPARLGGQLAPAAAQSMPSAYPPAGALPATSPAGEQAPPPAPTPQAAPTYTPVAPPVYPPYAYPAPPAYPPYAPYPVYPLYAPPQPPPARRTGITIAAIVGAILLVVVVAGGAFGVLAYVAHGDIGNPFIQATPAPSPTPTPAPVVVFQDPLLSNAFGWYVGTNCYFRADGYHIKNGYYCYPAGSRFGDATISVDARQVAGTPEVPYGIAFRIATDGSNEPSDYEFAIDGLGHWTFYKQVHGVASTIIGYTASSAISTASGAVNTLQVRSLRSHFVFSINGHQVGTADDTAFSSGATGLMVTGEGEAVFTNFTIAI
jgi:hypothetical protein